MSLTSLATVLLPLMSCVGPRHFPSLTGVKIPCVMAQVCFQMQFLPTAAASLGAGAAGCLGQAVAWDICQCTGNGFQYLSTDAITLGKGRWGFWCEGFFFSFVFICQGAKWCKYKSCKTTMLGQAQLLLLVKQSLLHCRYKNN